MLESKQHKIRRPHTIEVVIELLKQLTGVQDVFPSTFPDNANDTCIVVVFAGGQESRDTVMYPTLQVLVRSQTPDKAYDIAVSISDYLTELQDIELDSGQNLLVCRTQHPFPLI